MAFPWAAIPAGIQLFQLMQSRSAEDEIPGMREALQNSLQAQTNARTFARAAADPTSPWFRNLSALYREAAETSALKGVREVERRRQRLRARGVPGAMVSNPERRDESISAAIGSLFRDAQLGSFQQAQQALLNAAGRSSAVPNNFATTAKLYGSYGEQEDFRRRQIAPALSAFGKALGGAIGKGGNAQTNSMMLMDPYLAGSSFSG